MKKIITILLVCFLPLIGFSQNKDQILKYTKTLVNLDGTSMYVNINEDYNLEICENDSAFFNSDTLVIEIGGILLYDNGFTIYFNKNEYKIKRIDVDYEENYFYLKHKISFFRNHWHIYDLY
jgi:hypothetical protein